MNPGMRDRVGAYLEQLYERYNRPECVPPDPLQFPLRYAGAADREVVALLAASLAFGGVGQIATAVETVLERLDEPAAQVTALTEGDLRARLAGFRHRFVTGTEVAALLAGAGALIRRHGSLGACFADLQREEDETVLPALEQFVDLLRSGSDLGRSYILASPRDGSACKRLNLFLRWMVRRDAVDPGGWSGVSAARLVAPLDTHAHRLSRALGLTRRRQADLRTALEVTHSLRWWAPADPVRYDFALTRLGMSRDPEAFGDMPLV